MSSINSLVLDAGPLILQSYSSLQKLADKFYTTPSVYGEIKDERARQNLALWGDHLNVRQPKPESLAFVTEFAKKTGDYAVLSVTDLQVLALCYELELELNQGDWRLRKEPLKGTSIQKQEGDQEDEAETGEDQEEGKEDEESLQNTEEDDGWSTVVSKKKGKGKRRYEPIEALHVVEPVVSRATEAEVESEVESETEVRIESEIEIESESESEVQDQHHVEDESTDQGDEEKPHNLTAEELADLDFDNEEGWITYDNLRDTIDKNGGDKIERPDVRMKAAVSTGDFAMQNVALQIGLNLINPVSGLHIRKVRNYMLRCHGCFKLCQFPKSGKPLQFCPRCGGATLMRTTVSVSDDGKIQVHLKKNIQWWHRGDKYSIPTPQGRKARQKGQDRREENTEVLLRADQKEYEKAVKDDQWRRRKHEKMLEDWVGSGSADGVMSPFAISGYKRDSSNYKSGVKVGKGRYVNSSKHRR